MKPDQIELAWSLVCVLMFSWAEIRYPAHSVDRKNDWAWDLLGLAFVLGISGYLRPFFTALAPRIASAGVPSLNALATLPALPKILLALLVIDLALYGLHRAFHCQALWRVHELHHSIRHLTWFSGMRGSLLHIGLNTLTTLFFSFVIFRFNPLEAMIVFSLAAVFQFWSHTNLTSRLGFLNQIIITPQMHRLHHALHEARDVNFGSIFTLWDRVFGTYRDPAQHPREYELGLAPDSQKTYRSAIGF